MSHSNSQSESAIFDERMNKIREFLNVMIKSITEYEYEIVTSQVPSTNQFHYVVMLDSRDYPKVTGKDGSNLKAIRQLLVQAVITAQLTNVRVHIDPTRKDTTKGSSTI